MDALAISYGTMHGANKGRDAKIRREIAIATKECMRHEGIDGFLVSHGSSTVPQEFVRQINELGGRMENAYGINVDQLVDVSRCGINKINVDTDLRMASSRNVLELFQDYPELRESESVACVYRDLTANPANVDPRNYVSGIMDAILHGELADEDVELVDDCLYRGAISAIAPLLVQFGSYRNASEVTPVSLEEMADRYQKAGI